MGAVLPGLTTMVGVVLPGQKVVVHQCELQASSSEQLLKVQLISEQQQVWIQPDQPQQRQVV